MHEQAPTALSAPSVMVSAAGTEPVCSSAIDCTTSDAPSDGVSPPFSGPQTPSFQLFIKHSLAEHTRRAYGSDMVHFLAWGGTIPSTPEMIADYLASLAGSHATATLARRLASLSKAHRMQGLPNPVRDEIVRATMRGICRTYGAPQRQARALLPEDLRIVLEAFGERPKDYRDRALMLVGFAAALRRSELVALQVEDIELVEKGALVLIRRSKTDQQGLGRRVAVPNGRALHCPVSALKAWLTFSNLSTGPLFRAVDKHGNISNRSMSGEAVSDVVKTRLEAAGYEPAAFSCHSLRAGFVTAAALAGASSHQIRQTTGHKSDSSLSRYIRNLDPFAEAVLHKLF